MLYGNQKFNQEIAYKKLEDKIYKSDKYYKFVFYVTNLDSFRDVFTFMGDRFDAKVAGKAIENLDALRFICNNETGMKIENEFHDFIVAAVSEQDAISSIINVNLMETKYGNPKREQLDDYTLNEKLFGILEAVFGLDTLILSVNDKKVLQDRFNKVMKTDSPEEANKFIGIIEDIYNSVKDEENPLLVNEKIESWKEEIKPYVLAGLCEQLNEISNSKHQTFESYDILYKKVTDDILKIDKDKKM